MKMLDRAFAQAMDQAGVPEESEVCIRNLLAPVSLRLGEPDSSLLDCWSTAVAGEIAAAIGNGSPNSSRRTVIYYSRRQALLDLAFSVGRGDLRRHWAWRQLGLWRPGVAAVEAEAVSELVHALCNEPGMIACTLRALAKSGWFARMADRIAEEQWRALAIAALPAGRADSLLKETSQTPPTRVDRDAQRVVDNSPLLRATASSRCLVETSETVRRSVAILAVLDVEATLLLTAGAPFVIGIIAGDIGKQSDSASKVKQSIKRSSLANNVDVTSEPNRSPGGAGILPATNAAAANNGSPTASQQAGSLRSQPIREAAPDLVTSGSDAQKNHKSTRSDLREGLAKRVDEAEENLRPADLRQRAFTRFGGLLLLLSIVEDLKLPEQILGHPVLGERRFAWVVHQLALTLPGINIAGNDPAALAFAGLSPSAVSPLEQDGPATAIEAKALTEIAASIVDRLDALLNCEDELPANLLDFICRRRAEIVADPGWIEVRLSLDEISTEIRRIGLDIDPGYVPWLGVVVRFIYE
jgi:hypothetical protein